MYLTSVIMSSITEKRNLPFVKHLFLPREDGGCWFVLPLTRTRNTQMDPGRGPASHQPSRAGHCLFMAAVSSICAGDRKAPRKTGKWLQMRLVWRGRQTPAGLQDV